MHMLKQASKRSRNIIFSALLPLTIYAAASAHAEDLAASNSLCAASVDDFNQRFTTIASLDANGNFPEDSGLIVHTIHGPGSEPAELDLKKLFGMTPDLKKTCGEFMTQKSPVFLPWCGSNTKAYSSQLSDASSWTYLRHDTLINKTANQPVNEVACEASNNKRYGLIFNNAYMNEADNLGCMYPLDGDTGFRAGRGCGISENKKIDKADAQSTCPLTYDETAYIKDFDRILTDDRGTYASYAGSLICSLPKSKFDVWVDVRQNIDLRYTTWPLNEFVLWNWDNYNTAQIADNNVVTGIYYLSGCAGTSTDGSRNEALEIARLYKNWTTIDLPVVNLSNSELRQGSKTPFSCQ